MSALAAGPIRTSLDVLREPFRTRVRGILSDAVERRVYFVVTETLRDYARQEELVADGKSRTLRSKHLSGEAVDVVPVVHYEAGRVDAVTWDKANPAWAVLGELADKWGVVWGGRWTRFPDFPHLESSEDTDRSLPS